MSKASLIQALHVQLQEVQTQRHLESDNPEFLKVKAEIKNFQVKRIQDANADILANPNTHDALTFFLTEIYGAKDVSQRDRDLKKFISSMEKVFSEDTLKVVVGAITLDALVEKMDNQLAQLLMPGFTERDYMAAFSKTDRAEREEEINLVESLGLSLCELIQIPFLGATLKVMRMPAKVAGLIGLHEFLEAGFTTFKKTKNAQEFVKTLAEREREFLNQVYGKSPALKL